MIARRPHARRRRRGVVLILILAMLGLLALIGVTFATFSGQAKIGAEYTSQKVAQTSPDQVIDFALDQLVNDSSNFKSAIRGHSLLRDMYGRDYFTDPITNVTQGYQNIHLKALPEPIGQPLTITGVQAQSASNTTPQTPYVVVTNIPTENNAAIRQVPQLYGANFTGNVLRLQQWLLDSTNNRYTPLRQIQTPDRLTQTFEIVADNRSGSYHVFTLTIADLTTTASQPGGGLAFVQPEALGSVTPPANFSPPMGTTLADIFEIDGRYMHAFNGAGQGKMVYRDTSNTNDSNNYNVAQLTVRQSINGYIADFPYAAYPNYLYNRVNLDTSSTFRVPLGLNDPNARPFVDSNSMLLIPPQHDEDWDGPDNENMFLSLQTADGQVIIPSFHRPGNIVYNPNNATAENDWTSTTLASQAKFLRPRKQDHPQSGDSFPDLIPDANTGKITYDVDNDGDGVTDSVWVDLGYPVQRDPSGKKFKPLFAFMVQGLNGRLPLNTAGNLNKIAYDPTTQLGTHTPSHASHIGFSVNEINPEYALTPTAGTAPAGGQNYLQVMLQGNPTPTSGPAVEGRWGEVDIIKAQLAQGAPVSVFPRAGRSFYPNNLAPNATARKFDEFDTNYDGLDFYPKGPNVYPESADLLDNANRQLLPVERYRRFVTPIDLSGNGRIMPFDQVSSGEDDWGLGYDDRGRVGYFLYYRPPGIPANAVVDPNDYSTNILNRLHGYESYRNPDGSNRNVMAVMPSDQFVVDPMTMNNVVGLAMPSFSGLVNSNDPIYDSTTGQLDTTQNVGMFLSGSPALSDAAQMDNYHKTAYDAPFGLADQEYLDRSQDIDASALSSRLSRLLPDIFETDANKTLKRKLFVTETWDLGTWSAPIGSMGPIFGQPSINPTLANGSDSYLWTDVARVPSLAQGNRRFNLNLPLPASNSSNEPVRQKYVRELYELMKMSIAPPDGSSLSALQLATLGQFAVNVVDFRDPDATMTRFLNYDLVYTDPVVLSVDPNPGSNGTPVNTIVQPAAVAKATGTNNTNPVVHWGMEYNPIAINEVLGYSFTTRKAGATQDITAPRLFVELANTLTEDHYKSGSGTASDLDMNGWGFIITQDNPSITPPSDNTTARVERPNIVTGQLSQDTIDRFFVPLHGTGMGSTATPQPLPSTGLVKAIDQANSARVNYFTMGNDLLDGTDPRTLAPPIESNNALAAPSFTVDAKLNKELIQQIPAANLMPPLTRSSDYYWIHLLRPANPNSADMKNEPKVVVDSFRFPYFVSQLGPNGVQTDSSGNTTVDPDTFAIYSARRFQPYRGGHFVPRTDSAATYGTPPTNFANPYCYGYTEQTAPSGGTSGTLQGNYIGKTNGQPAALRSTGAIFHSFDQQNSNENWEYFPFHDRDFQSLAELFLVPSIPPGLFTKKFVELADPAAYNPAGPGNNGDLPPATADKPAMGQPFTPWVGYYYNPPFQQAGGTAPNQTNPVNNAMYSSAPTWSSPDYSINLRGTRQVPDPPTFPYLSEAFYYSWDDSSQTSFGTKSGWYRVLEFLEIPSNSLGYIGPVAAGQNADWARQDLRPGLLNLNLIADEEVFFGLIDDPRLDANPAFPDMTTAYYNYNLPVYGTTPSGAVGVGGYPRVATALYPNGMPSYTITAVPVQTQANPNAPPPLVVTSDRGYPRPTTPPASRMKRAWADFLKLRDGGSGLVFSPFSTALPLWGVYNTNLPNNGLVSMPSKPFRSLASADINDTVLRPARLPAVQLLNNPGVYENMGVYPGFITPRTPPRRLFQVPDGDPMVIYPNNGAQMDLSSMTNVNRYVNAGPSGLTPDDHLFLSNPMASLFEDTTDPNTGRRGFLGSSTPLNGTGGPLDHRWHPAFRTEMMSKVMNLTTVRTHQYAVWLTVGFFEVVREGNPQMADIRDPNTNVSMAVDLLGPEIGAAAGKQVRYRSYFLIDRTRATGFNPFDPGDFRDVIAFSRRIE